MKVVSTVLEDRFNKYGVHFPANYDVQYVQFPYTDEELTEVAKDADVIFVNSTHFVNENVIKNCKNLKLIHSEGVSYDKIDVKAASDHGVTVCNNRAVNAASVAEHCVGLMIAGLRQTARMDHLIKTNGYTSTKAQSLQEGVREMSSQRVGLIGMGVIGKEVVKRLAPWGCELCYFDVRRLPEEEEASLGLQYLDFDELIKTCDIISVHVPVIPSTLRMLGKEQFAAMKNTAIIVNISRGEIIDNFALADALEHGQIFAAMLDTVDPEPMPSWHPLLHLSPEAEERVTFTPHIAGMTDDAFKRMLGWSIENMERLERGEELKNKVN